MIGAWARDLRNIAWHGWAGEEQVKLSYSTRQYSLEPEYTTCSRNCIIIWQTSGHSLLYPAVFCCYCFV